MVTQSSPIGNPHPTARHFILRLAVVFSLVSLVSLLLLLLVATSYSKPALAAGAIHYVAPGGNCGSVSPCYDNIQDAVDAATTGDIILVAGGVYTDVTFRVTTTQTVFINKNLTLQGGFTITDWTTSDPSLNPTVLDAQNQGRVIYIDAANPLIAGFEIRNGFGQPGGGIRINGGSPILRDNLIYNNEAGDFGGGINIQGGNLLLQRNIIYNNIAVSFGGGLFNDGGTVTTQNNIFYDNQSNISGGAIGNQTNSFLTIQNDTFYNNEATTSGGALANAGSLTVTNTIIFSNTAGSGGAVSNSGVAVLDHLVVHSNTGGDFSGPGITTTNIINQDPDFVNAAAGDFHLNSGSPARNAGTPLPDVTDDFEGNGRPFEADYDIGADEYTDLSGTCFARVENGPVFTDVQSAVDAATAGQVVQVAGLCEGVQSVGLLDQTVYISKTLTLRGGYSVDNWSTPSFGPTILDAQSAGRVIYVTGATSINPVIENLHLTGGSADDGAGVFLGTNVNATLRNNVIYHNTATDNGGGVYNSGGGDALLNHNTIYSNTAAFGGGIYASSIDGSGEVTLRNNSITDNQNNGAESVADRFNFDYNNFSDNLPLNYNGPSSPGPNDISVPPDYVDPAGGDFHLSLSSQLINAADPASAVSTDFDNDSRPQGPSADIGADESLFYTAVALSEAVNSPLLVTDTAVIESERITFTHTITNLGTLPSGASDDFVIEVTNTGGWPFTVIGINTGVAVPLTVNVPVIFDVVVTVPASLPNSIFNQTIITATSQTNANTTATVSDVIANPGVILAPDYREGNTATPGEVLTFTHTLTNTGPTTDTYELSLTSPFGWGQLVVPQVPTVTTVTLASGATTPIVVRVQVSDTAPKLAVDVITVTATSLVFDGILDTATDVITAEATIGDRHVAPPAAGGTDQNNNCTDRTFPCATIGHAVAQSSGVDKILVAQGTYNEANTLNLNLNDLLGGYTTSFLGRTIDPSNTIINIPSSNGINIALPGQILVENFTLRDNTPASPGRGVLIGASTAPTLTHLLIENTSSTSNGGGVFIGSSAQPILDDVTILNTSANNGGAIYIASNGSPMIENVAISQTTATNNGGGIYVVSGSPVLSNTSVYSANATNGGGIYQSGGTVTGQKLTILSNVASNQGGGVYVAGTLTISQTNIGENQAAAGGGFYNSTGSSSTLWNNFIYNNATTSGAGGGIYNGGTLNLVNNTLYGNNAATSGGGVYDNNSTLLNISNTIVATNTATTGGGGLHRLGSGALVINYNNFWANTPANTNGVSTGPASISANPAFIDISSADFHLTPDSPSVDTGDPGTTLGRDFDDDIRPINQGFDMGADEVSGCLARVVNPNNQQQVGPIYGVLQEAIDAAPEDYIVQVSGICRGVQPRQLAGGQIISQTAFISKSLTLEGGYDPNGNTIDELSILDAEGEGRALVITGSVFVDITHLQLTGGNAAGLGGGPGGTNVGGGLYNYGGTLAVEQSVITGSQAQYGGGLYSVGGSLSLQADEAGAGTSIVNNSAALDGGGIYLDGSGPSTLQYTRLEQNQAGRHGGGLYHVGSSATLSRTLFYSNAAANNGGGLYNESGSIVAEVITAELNSATSGAGFYNAGGAQLDLQRGVLIGNGAATDGGGGYNAASGDLTMINTLVASNTTTSGNGGGLYNVSANLTTRHNTFYANNAGGQGGGIYHNANSASALINSTIIVSNTASSGGGIFSPDTTKPAFDYNNVWGNTGGDYGGTLTAGDGTGNISVPPNFISLSSSDLHFLRIVGGSPVEDQADPNSPVTIDIDGDPRPFNQSFDIGADEVGNCFVRINGQLPTYGRVQDAIADSSDGDEIRIAGTCQGVNPFIDGGQTVNQTAFLTKSLTLRGGYTKNNFNTSDPEANPTILDALNLGRVVYITNSVTVTIDGLRLGQGQATDGGAIFVGSGLVTMTNNMVYSSTATANGGALYNEAGSVYLTENNAIFDNNAVNGGAIYNAGGQITLDDNDLDNNQASNNGGAFYHAGGVSLLQNNIIRNNGAAQGGGIYNAAANLTVWHNTFFANTAGSGAGFFTTVTTPDVRNNIFANDIGSTIIHSSSGGTYTIDYNNIFPGSGSRVGGTAAEGVSIITADPQLIDPSNLSAPDFHIASTSPVIDQGDTDVLVQFDFDDESNPRDIRPGGQAPDLGADEIPGCRARIEREPDIIYGNIQRAVDNSIPGDVVQVTSDRECGGVHQYQVNGSTSISQTVHITHNLTLIGGYKSNFSGLTSPLVSTVINPAGNGRALLVTGTAVITLRNFNLTNGDATGLGGGPGGDAGGGLYFAGSSGSLFNVDISGSSAEYGAGLFNRAGDKLELIDSVIGPSIDTPAPIQGGGIYNETTLSLSESQVEGNTASQGGGGIYNTGLITLTQNSEVSNNQALDGGGLYNATGGTANSDFGVHIYANIGDGDGGGIYNEGDLTLWNTLIYGNVTASGGGGLYNAAGTSSVIHNTFYQNESTGGQGGGIYVEAGSVTIRNNIFDSHRVNSGGSAIHRNGGTVSLDYNHYYNNDSPDVSGVSKGANSQTGSDPSFVNPAAADFHLNADSPAIDQAEDPAAIDHDLDDNPRPVNNAADIGADEYASCLVQWVEGDETFGRIQAGLDAAGSGDTLKVAAGTCQESIAISKDVTISGSWEPDFSGQTDDPVTTNIDATGTGSRVIFINSVSEVNISRVNVLHGDIGGSGGGILSNAAELNLTTVNVLTNTASQGGGIYIAQDNALNIQGGTVSGNVATGDGGGIYHADGVTSVIVGTVENNRTTSGNGGGIYNGPNSDVNLDVTGIDGNRAVAGNGGGVYNNSAADVLLNGGESVKNNEAENGGGIYNSDTPLTLRNKGITGNTAAPGNGGGLYTTGSSEVNATNSLFYANTSENNGGGIYQNGGSTTVYHNTIHQNEAGLAGGGVYNASGSMVISASIIAFNDAPTGSGVQGDVNIAIAYTLRWDNDYNGSFSNSNGLDANPLFDDPIGLLNYASPAIDAVPTSASSVVDDAFLDPRPAICAKDMGLDEYRVGLRRLVWGAGSPHPVPAEATVTQGDSFTYTFPLQNQSQTWSSPAHTVVGSGYTETVTVTLNSTQLAPWQQEIVDAGANGTILNDKEAIVVIGPAETVNILVKVTVPPNAPATIETDDSTKDFSTLTFAEIVCDNFAGPSLGGTKKSNPAITSVEADQRFIVGPDNTGAALPGMTLTYTHIITNQGNSIDTYTIVPSKGFYDNTPVIIDPSPAELTLSPHQTGTITLTVTIEPWAAGDLVDVASVIVFLIDEEGNLVQDTAVDRTVISPTTGTRYVSTNGVDSTVDETAGNPDPDAVNLKDNNCTQPAEEQGGPCRTIQQAVSQAAPGDLIKIEGGTYGVVLTDIITTTYNSQVITQVAFIDKAVTLQGGYDSANDWAGNPPDHTANPTILDVQGLGRGVFITDAPTGTVTLDRLVITGGNAGTDDGGAIYNEGADVQLRAVRIQNSTGASGGGLYSGSGNLLIQNSWFHDDSATTGGAVYVEAGSAILENNTFFRNEAPADSGAIRAEGGNLLISNTIVAGTIAGYGLSVSSSASLDAASDYNLYHNNASGPYFNGTGSATPPGSNNVSADPIFIDTGTPPDLHVGPGSPALDEADPNTGLTIDYDNDVRPIGGFDIGADERVLLQSFRFYSDTITSTLANTLVVITHTLENTGETTDTYTLSRTSSQPWPFTIEPPLASPITLGKNLSQMVTVTYTIPATATGLTNVTIITASSATTAAIDTVRDEIKVRGPRWDISKVANPTTIGPGGRITYTLTVTNIGDLVSSGTYTITDPLPTYTTFESGDPGPDNSPDPVQWVLSDPIPISGTLTLTYFVTADSVLTDGLEIVNQNYTVTGGGTVAAAVGSPVIVTVEAPATLTAVKTANTSLVRPGDLLTYTITITNDASAVGPAVDVVVTDNLPANVSPVALGFVSPATGTTTINGNNLEWHLSSAIPANDFAQVTATVQVDSPLAADTILTNTFGVTASNIPAALSGSITTVVTATNSITLSKTVEPTVVDAGGTVTYTISLTNTGDSIADVALTDLLDPDFTPTTVVTNVQVPGQAGGGTPGTATVSFTATAPSTPGTYYNDVVTATYGAAQAVINQTAPVTVQNAIAGLTLVNDSPTVVNQTTTFTASITAGSSVSYTLNFGDGSPVATGSLLTLVEETHSYTQPGVYTAIVTASNTLNVLTATTVVTIDEEITGLSADNDSPTPLGSPTALTATITTGSNVSFIWDFGDGNNGSGALVNHTYAATGTYTATVTASNSVGVFTATTIVNIIEDFPITGLTAVNDSPTLFGNTTNFTATITGGSNVAYTWSFGDGNTGTSATPGHTYGAVGTYTAIVTATNSVSLLTATTVVTINEEAIAGLSAGNDSPTIVGNSTLLFASVVSGTNVVYTWDLGDGNTGTGQNVNHTYAATGTYTAIVTATNSLNQLTATTTVTVTDQAIADLTAANDSPTPLGNTTHFTATVSAGTSIVYTWDFGDGNTGTGPNVSHTYVATGTYTAIVTASNSLNQLTATTPVTITDEEAIAGLTAINDSPTPLGNSTNFTATITAGSGVTYTWSFGDGNTGVGALVNHTYVTTGTYTAIVTASNSSSLLTATTTVTITDEEAIAGLNAINDSPTLLGNSTNFTATITAGSGVTYTWNFGDGNTGVGQNAAHTYAATGTYTAIVTASNSTNLMTATTVVTIDEQITGLTAINDSPTPLGNTTNFTATITGGSNVTYMWNFGDGNTGIGASVGHTYGAMGIYTAIVTATNSASLVTATTVVTIENEEAIAGLSAINDSPTPLGGTTNFTATITAGSNISYTWNFGDGNTGVGALVNHTYAVSGTYTAIVTASNSINLLTATTTVTITKPDDPVTGLTATNDSPTELGNVTTFTATITSGDNVVYTWNFGDGSTGSGATVGHTYVATGTYTALVTATNSTSLVTATTRVTITDIAITGLNAANDSPTILGNITNFTATITTGSNVTYAWNFGDGNTGTGATPAHTYGAVGTYTATVTATNSAGLVTDTTTVTVIDEAVAGLTAINDSPTPLSNSTNFTATITAGTGVTYTWNFGDGNTGAGATIAHTYTATGTYTAVVTASNTNNILTATTIVTITDEVIAGLNAINDSPTGLGLATTLTATVTSGSNISYAWDFGDGTFGTGAINSHVYPALGTYTATVTATNSINLLTATTVVDIVEQPVAGLSAINDSPTLLGNVTSFTATITAGSNVTYTWSFGDGNTGIGATISHTYATTGTYTAIVTAANSFNSLTATTTVIVDEGVTGLVASNDSPTELGNPTTLTATITTGSNVTYAWDFGDGNTGTGAVLSHTYTATGTYTALVTASNSVSLVTATTTVTITDEPVAGLIAFNDSPTALGQSTGFTAMVFTGTNVIFRWDFGDGNTGTGAVVSHTYVATGTYTALVTASNSISLITTTTTVTIEEGIAGLIASNDSPTILGNLTTFTATTTAGDNIIYTWNFGDGNSGAGANTTHTYAATGIYNAVVTATNSVSVVTATTVVTVDETITGLVASNDSPTELGNPTILTATITTGSNVTYIWDFGDGTTGSGATISHTYTATGTYTALVTASNSVNLVTATTTITVADQPISGLVITHNGPGSIGNAVTFTATVASGTNVNYTWNFGDGTTGSGATINHTYLAEGTYTVIVTATNSVNQVVTTTTIVISQFAGEIYLPLIINGTVFNNLPDLIVTAFSVTPNGDGSYAVSVTAINNSAYALPTGNNFHIGIYSTSDLNTPLILFGVQDEWFPPGQGRTLTTNYTFSGTGTLNLRAWADPFNVVVEVNDTNNTRDLSVSVTTASGEVAPQNQPAEPQPTPTNLPK